MSLKLSRNKVNCLASLITEYIEQNEDLDYNDDIGNIRFKIFQLVIGYNAIYGPMVFVVISQRLEAM